jgi:hypothetical protein
MLHLAVVAMRRAAKCPLCHRRSKRVHSRYERTITDLPCAGGVVTIHLSTRRFVCRVRLCQRKIFTERLPSLVAPLDRQDSVEDESATLAGYGKTRWARHLSPASPSGPSDRPIPELPAAEDEVGLSSCRDASTTTARSEHS